MYRAAPLLLLALTACDDPVGACLDGTDDVVVCHEDFRSVCDSRADAEFAVDSTCVDEGYDIPASDCDVASSGWLDEAGCAALLAES